MRKVEIKETYVTHAIRTIEGTLALLALGGVFWQAVVKQNEQNNQDNQNAPSIQESSASVFNKIEEAVPVFSAYFEELPKKGISKEYIIALASVPDSEGKPYLSPEDISSLYQHELSAEEATLLLRFRKEDGNPLFTVLELIKTKEYCTLDEAVALVSTMDDSNTDDGNDHNPLLTGFDVYRVCKLNFVPQYLASFANSEKPNALLIYPASDYNGAFESKEAVALFHEIQSVYDVKVAFAKQDGDIAAAIHSVPDIELLMVAGHGTPTTLNLGGEESSDETYNLDTSDTELGDALNTLHPHATIFLNSCSTGEDERSGDNLANFIRKQAKERTVIAPTESFEQREITIGSLYPFDVKIIRDITYNTKK